MKLEKFKNKIKKAAAPCLLAMMMSYAASAAPIQAELNGRDLYFDQPPVMQDGRVLVPLRGIFENLGADVLYDPSTRRIKATGDSSVVELTLGERQALVNGKMTYLDVPAGTIGGRTMVPLRFVSEAMGADVRWQSADQTVVITSDRTTASNPQNNQNDQPITSAQIDKLIHNARGPLSEGDQLRVTMVGTPGGRATFSILGAAEGIQMNETSSGRYEGYLNVRRGMSVDRGTLVATLNVNGRETVEEADRAINIDPYQANQPGNTQNAGTYLVPSANEMVSQARPQIRVNFQRPISNNSVEVYLDGVNVSNQARVVGYQVQYDPTWNLNVGQHTVQVNAWDQTGQQMSQRWDFSVSPTAYQNQNGYPTTNNNVVPTVSVTNLNSGGTVPAVFNLQGQTQPYTTVKVEAQSQRDLVPGIIGIRGQTLRAQTVADASGNFNLQLDTRNMPSDADLDLTIIPVSQDGRQGTPVEMDLRKR